MDKEEQVITGLRNLFNKMGWLNKVKMEDRLKEYKPSEVHFLEFIGKNADCNVTKLADAFYMTRGAISKLAQKLISKGYVENYQKPDNKKEIYFRLTEQGREVYHVHESLHKEFQERDRVVFDPVTEEQFDAMLHFIERYSRHLDAEIAKMDLDTKLK